ncbi:MAG: EVE domain-containing protein [Polyangiaceae bacterium]
MPGYWLIKSEPDAYPYAQLVKDKRTAWDGVRSFEARNNLRGMRVGDLCLYYHSMTDKAVVGVARVVGEAYADPSTDDGGDWSAVDMVPVTALKQPVTLAAVKADPALADTLLVRRSRVSVVPVSRPHFERILALGKTKLPRK